MRLIRLRPYALGAAIAAVGLVAANGVAVATTGHAFVLGTNNSADAATTLSRTTAGPALALRPTSGSPALSVSNARLVKHLNADAVDGKSAAALSSRVIQYSFPSILDTADAHLLLPGLPPGRYLASYAVSMQTTVNSMGITCSFHATNGDDDYRIGAYAAPIATSTFASASASGVLDTRHKPFELYCFASGGKFQWLNGYTNYSTVTFLRLDGVASNSGTDASLKVGSPAGR